MGKRKSKTMMQQFDWLEEYLKDDNHPCKKHFLKLLRIILIVINGQR